MEAASRQARRNRKLQKLDDIRRSRVVVSLHSGSTISQKQLDTTSTAYPRCGVVMENQNIHPWFHGNYQFNAITSECLQLEKIIAKKSGHLKTQRGVKICYPCRYTKDDILPFNKIYTHGKYQQRNLLICLRPQPCERLWEIGTVLPWCTCEDDDEDEDYPAERLPKRVILGTWPRVYVYDSYTPFSLQDLCTRVLLRNLWNSKIRQCLYDSLTWQFTSIQNSFAHLSNSEGEADNEDDDELPPSSSRIRIRINPELYVRYASFCGIIQSKFVENIMVFLNQSHFLYAKDFKYIDITCPCQKIYRAFPAEPYECNGCHLLTDRYMYTREYFHINTFAHQASCPVICNK